MDDSRITIDKVGTMYAGRDAVELFRVKMLISGLKLNASTGMLPTRGMTKSKMLAMAGQYTKRKYKRTEMQQAIDDLKEFYSLLASSLPIEKI